MILVSYAHYSSRELARLGAIQALYEYEMIKTSSDKTVLFIMDEFKRFNFVSGPLRTHIEADVPFFETLIRGVAKHGDLIDETITPLLKETWSLARLPVVCLCLLRLGFYELLFEKEIPGRIIVSEYSDLAADFLELRDVNFANGIFHKMFKITRPQEGIDPCESADCPN